MALTAAAQAQSNSFVTIASEPSYYAWWLRAQFQPFETQVRGVPVGRLHPPRCVCSALPLITLQYRSFFGEFVVRSGLRALPDDSDK